MIIFIWAVSLFYLAATKETVKFAAVIYRHGDRTPVDTYPTDPWRNESLWPVKFGELTNIGKRQHYALGQWLRKRYSHLLSDAFDRSQIYVRSTDVDRTLMSAQVNLAGMYPPYGKSVWDADLMWQPIPVHTVPEKQDEVLAMKKSCAVYDKEMKQFVQSKAYKEKLNKYQRLMDYLTAYTGKKIKDYVDIVDVYSILYIETLYNFTLPKWTQTVYPDTLREPACYSFAVAAATPLMARLRTGPLLKEIVSKMTKAISDQSSKALKVSIYSGHDFTIGNILTALGVFDGNCPMYTATILMELVYDNSTASHFIRISYRNSTEIVEPHVLYIPYCGKMCPVDKFIKLYDNLLTVDFDYECGIKLFALRTVSIVGLSILAVIYVTHKVIFYKIYRKKQRRFRFSYSKVEIAPLSPGKKTHI